MHSDPRRCLLQSAIPIFSVEDGTRRAPARCQPSVPLSGRRTCVGPSPIIPRHSMSSLGSPSGSRAQTRLLNGQWKVCSAFKPNQSRAKCFGSKGRDADFPRVGDHILRKVSERRLDPEPVPHHAAINPFRTWHAAVRNHLVELSDPRRGVHGRATLATLTYCSPAEPSRIAPAVIGWRPFQELIHGGRYAPP